MILKRFLLRYYPPRIILEIELRDKSIKLKEIDLLDLSPATNVNALANEIIRKEPLLSEGKKPYIVNLISKLLDKTYHTSNDFFLFKTLKAHVLRE